MKPGLFVQLTAFSHKTTCHLYLTSPMHLKFCYVPPGKRMVAVCTVFSVNAFCVLVMICAVQPGVECLTNHFVYAHSSFSTRWINPRDVFERNPITLSPASNQIFLVGIYFIMVLVDMRCTELLER